MRRIVSFWALLAISVIITSDMQAQTAAALVPVPNIPFYDSSTGVSLPCVGCFLYSYAAGTTNQQATYTDSSKTATNSNPIQLNSAGYNPAGSGSTGVWLGPTCYKFELRNSFGVTIWTIDLVCNQEGLLQAALIGSSGAGLVGFSQTTSYPTGTVGSKLQQQSINVTDAPYGAKCDNSADDSIAINGAASAASVLYFPQGKTCLVKSAITLGTISHHIQVVMQGTILNSTVSSGVAVTLGQLSTLNSLGLSTINCTGSPTACLQYGPGAVNIFGGFISGVTVNAPTSTCALRLGENIVNTTVYNSAFNGGGTTQGVGIGMCANSGTNGIGGIGQNTFVEDLFTGSQSVVVKEDTANGFIEMWHFFHPTIRSNQSNLPSVQFLGVSGMKAVVDIMFVGCDCSFANGGTTVPGGGTMGTLFQFVQADNVRILGGECEDNYICSTFDSGSCDWEITADQFGTTTPYIDASPMVCNADLKAAGQSGGNVSVSHFRRNIDAALGVQTTINDPSPNPAIPCFGASNLASSPVIPYFVIQCPGDSTNGSIRMGIYTGNPQITFNFDGSISLGGGNFPIIMMGSPQTSGTKFTATGCTAITNTHGGGWGGDFTIGQNGPCTVTITINGATGANAPIGWVSTASDLTAGGLTVPQSGSSTTQITLAIPTGASSGDGIHWAIVTSY